MTAGSDRTDPTLQIVGLGTDLVEIPRFRLAMERRGERLGLRLFSDDERAYAYRQKDPAKSLAALGGIEGFAVGSFSLDLHAYWKSVPAWAAHILRPA